MNQKEIAAQKLAKAETFIGYLLLWGVQICGAAIAMAWVGCLIGDHLSSLEMFTHPNAHEPVFLKSVFEGVLQFDPKSGLYFGLLLLIALPIFRVGTTIFIFILQRDTYFIVFSSVVFSILIFSLLAGKSL